MCTNEKMSRPKGIMSSGLFKKIIDEIAEIRPVSYLHLYGIGDPLMDSDVLKKMEYLCKTKELKNYIFGTNGNLLLKNNYYKPLIDMNIAHMTIDVDRFTDFQDADGFEVFGDVNNQSIMEIWQTTLREKRSEHVQGIFFTASVAIVIVLQYQKCQVLIQYCILIFYASIEIILIKWRIQL